MKNFIARPEMAVIRKETRASKSIM